MFCGLWISAAVSPARRHGGKETLQTLRKNFLPSHI